MAAPKNIDDRNTNLRLITFGLTHNVMAVLPLMKLGIISDTHGTITDPRR